jgi:hypothetical protein
MRTVGTLVAIGAGLGIVFVLAFLVLASLLR